MRFLLFTLLISLISTNAHAEEIVTRPDYTRESSGLLSSDLQGAFPKAVWKDQPRSEVQYLLENMPTNGTNRSIQELKRKFLISQGDTRLIKNDIKVIHYQDIFSLRLKNLMKLGFYDDAFRLYTNMVETPETSELAEIGLLLTLDKQGISTTCLDVKVLTPSFNDSLFFGNMNALCDREMGTPTSEFKDSTILQGIYDDKDFFLPAQYTERFLTFTPLELHALFKKEKVNYDGLKEEHISSLAPQITRFFLNSESFPTKLKPALQEHAFKQNLSPEEVTQDRQDDSFNIKEASQVKLENALKQRIATNQTIPEEWIKRLYTLATDSPQNYIYIQFLSLLGLSDKQYDVPKDKWDAGIAYFTEKSAKNLIYIKTALDKQVKFSNNPPSVYEKRLVLSKDGQYQLPEETEPDLWSGWQQEAEIQNYIGLSFLIALHNDPNDQSFDQTLRVLSSLSTVGLIDKTHILGREYFANMVGNK